MDAPLVVASDAPAISPTGQALIPPAALPWLTGLLGLAALGAQLLPAHTIAAQVCGWIVALGGPLLGIASPGFRKPEREVTGTRVS